MEYYNTEQPPTLGVLQKLNTNLLGKKTSIFLQTMMVTLICLVGEQVDTHMVQFVINHGQLPMSLIYTMRMDI